MQTISLDAQPRTVMGKKVRFLRRQGIVPVNVFGHNVESLALQVEAAALERALARAGTNTLISLNIPGAAEPRRVLIRGHQRKPHTSQLLHVDLYQVSMTETITTEVPIVLVGQAPATITGGVLLKNLESVEIECLPGDLVAAIEVDVSTLTDFDSAILVGDLKLSDKIRILTNPETVIAKIMPPEREEAEAAPAAEAVPAEAAAPAGEQSA